MIFFSLLFGGLTLARAGAIVAAGQSFAVPFGEMPQSYNAGALLFYELPMLLAAIWICRKQSSDGAIMPLQKS
jgi:hypothetical protein